MIKDVGEGRTIVGKCKISANGVRGRGKDHANKDHANGGKTNIGSWQSGSG